MLLSRSLYLSLSLTHTPFSSSFGLYASEVLGVGIQPPNLLFFFNIQHNKYNIINIKCIIYTRWYTEEKYPGYKRLYAPLCVVVCVRFVVNKCKCTETSVCTAIGMWGCMTMCGIIITTRDRWHSFILPPYRAFCVAQQCDVQNARRTVA